MKLSRLAGCTALAVLAMGQARAEPTPVDDGLGFGIIRDLTTILRPAAMTPGSAVKNDTDTPLKIERIEIVRSDAMRLE